MKHPMCRPAILPQNTQYCVSGAHQPRQRLLNPLGIEPLAQPGTDGQRRLQPLAGSLWLTPSDLLRLITSSLS
jgi:hypothetical protein